MLKRCSRGAQINRLLFRREKIEKQCREAGVVERARDKLIPRAVPAAAAAVSEKHEGGRSIGNCQIALQGRASRCNVNLVHVNFCAARASNSRTSSSLIWEKSS